MLKEAESEMIARQTRHRKAYDEGMPIWQARRNEFCCPGWMAAVLDPLIYAVYNGTVDIANNEDELTQLIDLYWTSEYMEMEEVSDLAMKEFITPSTLR